MMNLKAIINGKEYRFIKTETDMITNRTAVLFENEHGCSFICPVEAWLENAKREEPAFNKYISPEKRIALFKSLFIGRKTGKMMSPLSEPCADSSIYRYLLSVPVQGTVHMIGCFLKNLLRRQSRGSSAVRF